MGSEPRHPALVYFAKAPLPGTVKTRLCPPLTAAEAAGLYAGMLRDILVPVPGCTTYVYGWPAEQLQMLPIGDPVLQVRAQRGASLAERMQHCMAELFAAGHDAVAIRNTDSPDIQPRAVAAAVLACRPGRLVLGPDQGGGYYLIGLCKPVPELWQGLADRQVYQKTVSLAQQLGLELMVLPQELDVDVAGDLWTLWLGRLARGRGE